MSIDYIKLNPTGNITLLVTSPVPRERQAELAARLLEEIGGEQVGYVEAPARAGARARLQMMGGEFCGNATMSLGAVIARGAGLPPGASADLLLEVSGCAEPVPCRIERLDGAWRGTVEMPLPTALREITLETDAGALAVPLVDMPGISHLILPAGAGPDEAQLRRRLPEWNRAVGAEALGALTWDAAASSIDPIVYVPSAGTLVREHGCGSGSAAVGCWLAMAAGRDLRAGIQQPGGVIEVGVCLRGSAPDRVTITGTVTIDGEGKMGEYW